jgi:acyl transferase domain-containing protein
MDGNTLPLLLSGTDAVDLARRARALRSFLNRDRDADLAAVAAALLAEPAHGDHRAVVLAGDLAGADAELGRLARGAFSAGVVSGEVPATRRKLAFVFPGQGSHRPNMCRDLYDRFPAYRDAFDEVAAHFDAILDLSMRDIVFTEPDAGGRGPLDRPRNAHSSMFVVEYALVRLLDSVGLRPDVVAGYSGGEDISACVAGMVALPDMCRLIVERAVAIEELAPAGGMLAVQAARADVEPLLGDDAFVAGVNGPASVVLGGTNAALARVEAGLAARSVRSRRVRVDNPFHTPYLNEAVAAFTGRLAVIDCAAPRVPFVSTVTGELVDGPLDVIRHWGRHFEQPVLFHAAVEVMRGLGVTTYLEVGPGGTLTAMLRQMPESEGTRVVSMLPRHRDDADALLSALAELHADGVGVDFGVLCAGVSPATLPGDAPADADDVEPGPAAVDPVAEVYALVAAVLGAPALTTAQRDRPFLDLGMESVTAVELRHRINAALGVDLPLTAAFDHPTPAALAEHVRDLISGAHGDEPQWDDTDADDDPVVVVGMACRFPGGVETPHQLWQLLLAGGDAIGEPPAERGWTGPAWPGGYLADAAGFDAAFFGISPDEALTMDPQQRLLLETAWTGLEDAGVDPGTLRGQEVGVFVGGMTADYGPRLREAAASPVPPSLTGTLGSVLSGRVSYALGLQGPSLTVDTACSSSLVALHLAAQSLRAGECPVALVAGVTVMPDDGVLTEFARQGGLAPDGRCRAFSEAAEGTGFAEGVGVLVLQRLSVARRAGRPVLAVLRGSAVNSDGASNGLTAPNGRSQQRVIRQALRRAGLAPGDVDVVEAHGTGTRLGDPIEAQALLSVYNRDRTHPLLVGSVKSNIGHTQAAAGAAGVIKVVQAMRHGVLPATLHVGTPTMAVAWDGMTLPLTTTPWPATGRPRRAGVSAFGISGTNAHVLLEQGDPLPVPIEPPDVDVPWVFSARSEPALRGQAARLAELTADPTDVAHSLLTTRASFEHRAVVLAGDAASRRAALTAFAAGEPAPAVVSGRVREHPGGLAVVFAGQGGQRAGMGAGLREHFPVFAEALADVLIHLPGRIADVFTPSAAAAVTRTDIAQPALFALEVALFRLLESWGVRPDHLAGHSVGEIAAAHVAGVLSLPDAARLAAERGRLMQRLPAGGAMLAVEVGAEELAPVLPATVVVSAINAPRAVVVGGPETDVLATAAMCADRGWRTKRLQVSHAFHTPLMDPVLPELAEVVRGLAFHPAHLPILSTVTGKPVDQEMEQPEYWTGHARQTVLFSDAVAALREHGVDTFVEAGPDRSLSGLIGADAVAVLHRDQDERAAVRTALAELHVRGVELAAAALVPPGRRVALPGYAFDRRPYWLSPTGVTTSEVVAPNPGLADELTGLSAQEQHDRVLAVVRRELAFVVDRAVGDDPERLFTDMGMDSLGAVRMRDRLAAATGVPVPATAAYDCPNPLALTRYLLLRLLPDQADAAAGAGLDAVERSLSTLLSDRTARARLRARLRSLLDRLDTPTARPLGGMDDGGAPDIDVSEVSVEELFELIDREFEDL